MNSAFLQTPLRSFAGHRPCDLATSQALRLLGPIHSTVLIAALQTRFSMLPVLEGRALPCISSPRQLGHEGIERARLGFWFQNTGASWNQYTTQRSEWPMRSRCSEGKNVCQVTERVARFVQEAEFRFLVVLESVRVVMTASSA